MNLSWIKVYVALKFEAQFDELGNAIFIRWDWNLHPKSLQNNEPMPLAAIYSCPLERPNHFHVFFHGWLRGWPYAHRTGKNTPPAWVKTSKVVIPLPCPFTSKRGRRFFLFQMVTFKSGAKCWSFFMRFVITSLFGATTSQPESHRVVTRCRQDADLSLPNIWPSLPWKMSKAYPSSKLWSKITAA